MEIKKRRKNPAETSIRYLKGVGPRRQEIFNQKAAVYTVADLLYYFPFRYEDRTNFVKIKDLKADVFSLVEARVAARNLRKLPYFLPKVKVKSIFEVILEDPTGRIKCTWFNQAYLSGLIKVGRKFIFYGKASCYKGKLQLVSPQFERPEKSKFLNAGKITPIYRTPVEFSQRYLRKIIFLAVKECGEKLPDPIPPGIRRQENFAGIGESLRQIHFPDSWEAVDFARRRFIFEELFISQVMVHLRKSQHRLQPGPCFEIKEKVVDTLKKSFTFSLTEAQNKALEEILLDLGKNYPMRRLLQGDVGSGKTAVAIFPIILAALSGWQAALMAPTEALAYQHKKTLDNFFQGACCPVSFLKDKVELLTSSLPSKEKALSFEKLKKQKSLIAVGTHSLIQKGLEFGKLGVVVIDEQHKFGVAQRALLPRKGKISPNCLVMSATPIPRSLALSLYGDLDCSVIDRLPPGRPKPKTILVEEEKRDSVYSFVSKQVEKGKQVYIVYPVIDSDELAEVKSLNQMHAEIQSRFSKFSLAIFHGRLKSEEKLKVIEDFRQKRINILISTNVVEVGLDVGNATTMVVESPHRFGLSQLHQLRGRIQRSSDKATFILICGKNISGESRKRLKIISREQDGFKIAEEDLKLRGPGDFFGRLQHGLPDLRVANPLRDLETLKKARKHAEKWVQNDPYLEAFPVGPKKRYLAASRNF